MSHEANIYCKDCNVYNEESFRWNTIDDLLKLYVKILKENPELKNFLYALEIECYTEVSNFIRDHITHNIYIHGEYNNDPKIKL